ncbi:MAG: type II secretion system protein GspM [Pseudomonadota bacterium]
MMQWWETREPRERLLLSIAALLTLLVLGYLLVISPLSSAREDASRALASAQADRAIVERGIAAIGSADASSSGAAPDVDDFRTMVTRSAREAGLSLSRVQRGSDGTIQLRFDDAEPPRLFAWLATIEAEPGGEIVAASISARNDERIEAVIELRGGRA